MTDKPVKRRRSGASARPPDVETFLAELKHPLEREILLLRSIILAADPRITESIKWNAPSFSTTEHFATFHLRAKDAVQVVLHRGAKPRPGLLMRNTIADPAALLDWRSADRATVTFHDLQEVEARRKPFADIVREWVKFV